MNIVAPGDETFMNRDTMHTIQQNHSILTVFLRAETRASGRDTWLRGEKTARAGHAAWLASPNAIRVGLVLYFEHS